MPSAGAAYLFGRTTAPFKLIAPMPQDGARFGTSIATGDFDGDGTIEIAIGALLARQTPDAPAAGMLYFFQDDGAGLRHSFSLACPDQSEGSSGSSFGARTSVLEQDGTTVGLAVSRMGAPVGLNPRQGIVDFFSAPIGPGSKARNFYNPVQDEEQDGEVRWGMFLDVTPRAGGGYRLAVGHPRQDRLRLDGSYAITTGSTTVFDVLGTTIVQQSVRGARDYLPEFANNNYFGFRTLWADVVGDGSMDHVVLTLNDGPGLRIRRLWIYDGDDLNRSPVILTLPLDASDHPADGIAWGQLIPGNGKDDVVHGDNRWGPNSSNQWL